MLKVLRDLTKKLAARYQRKQLAKVRHQRFLNIIEQTKDI